MRNFVQSRRLKALFALVFLSFVGVEVNAQDTVTVEYTHDFTRNQTYCSADDQFDDWVTFLDSIETLQATGDYRFIEAKYSSTDGSSTKEHVYDGVDIDPFITDLVSLDTISGSATYVAASGDDWWITSGCEVSGSAAIGCASGAYPRIAVEINPTVAFGCNPNVESALRPVTGSSSWGGSFGATSPQSVSTSGPTETISFTVRYVDAANPIPVCYTDTVDVYVDQFGGYNLQISDIDSFSYDEFLDTLPGAPTKGWGIETYTLSTTTVTCDSLGARNVLLTIVDYAGNDSTCTTVINVLDTLNPTALAADTTVYLDNTGTVVIDPTFLNAGSFDNCNAGGFIFVSDTLFDCTGVFSDTLVMIDGSGNTDTAYAMVTVLDTISPTANCIAGPFELYLDSNGVAVLTADSLDDNSTDNVSCSNLSFSVDIDSFFCADAYTTDNVGPIDVILTVTDSSGNTSTCTTQVEVFDTIAPQPDILDSLTIYVNQSGIATIDSSSIDLGTSDACLVDFLDIDITTVSCDSVDSTFYTYIRVGDWYGNVSDEDSVFVTVLDTIAPVLDLNDTILAYLDASGNYTLDSATVDNATADNCTGFTLNIGKTLFDCAEAGDTVAVTITATDLDNTPSTSTQDIYVIVQDTVAPVMTTVSADTIYLDASGSISVDSNQFATAVDSCGILSIVASIDSVDCADIASSPFNVTTTATDSNNNTTSEITSLTVLDTLAPNLMLNDTVVAYLDVNGNVTLDSNAFDASSTDNCAIDSFALSLSSFDCSYINATNDSSVTVTTYAWDSSDNLDSATAIAVIMDTIAPVVTCTDTTVYLDANGMAIIDTSFVIGSVDDNCPSTLTYALSQDTITCADYDTVLVTLTVTDAQGNVGTCVSTIVVEDTLAPVAMANNVTIYSDSMGIAKLDSQFVRDVVDNGSYDNCSFVLTVSDSIFDCSQEGLNLVTLTATDIAGNTGTVDFFVTVNDTIKPEAIGKDVTIALNNNGMVSIDPSLIDSASWDNCMDNMTFDLSQTNFDCSNLGPNNVVFSVQDGNGQADTMTVVVTIIDQTLPNAIAQNITAYLDATGQVVITAADVNNGSVDNCALDTMWLSKDTLTCDDLGVTPISLYVADVNGNQNSAAALVTVLDTIAPVVVTQNVTLYLDSAGNIPTVDAALFDNGTTDNCSYTAKLLSNIDYDCTHVGPNSVDIEYTDLSGNEVTVSATLTIVDSIAPIAMAQDISVELNADGTVAITPAMINNNSYDDCTSLTYALDVTSFDCTNVGANTVVLTVTDASGNATTATSVVTVSDVTAPVLNLNALTRSLDASGNVTVTAADFDNGSTDSCGISTTVIDVTTFDCSNIGLNTITFTATDVNGNVSTGTTTLTIVDDMLPTVVGQDYTAYLNADGNATITVSDIDNGSTDNCEISLSLDVVDFDCTTTGTNDVILTGVDASGNTSTDTVTVTVLDTISPMAVAQDISVELDANGDATITTAMINNNSSDNCAGITYALDVTSFNCTNVGANTVVLTVTDASGNASTATSVVTVSDVTAPVVSLNALTRSLDASGNVTVTAADFNNGTADSCGIASTVIDVTTFDCSNIGLNTITFTATDVNGNVSIETTTLTIVDDMLPTVVGQDITVNLNADGNVAITVADIDNGSTDNCEISLSIDVLSFDCTMTGANEVILTGVDASGNTSADTVTVTVVDDILPTAIAQNVIAVLDASGVATITPEMVDNGSFDNCSGISLALSNTTYQCFLAGTNQNVSLEVTDASGNVSYASAVVSIVDNSAPTVNIQAITRSLDATGNVTVTAADFNAGTSDNCSISSLEIDLSSFDCSHVGNNTITFTATDASGNVSTGTTTLTIVDDEMPTAITQDITVQLNAEGNATITSEMVDNGSTDNCNYTLSIDITEFDCTHIGTNDVILTVTDENGNVSTSTAVVTIEDNVTPIISTRETYTVYLDATGNATITAEELNLSSSDNCASSELTYHFSNGFTGSLSCSDIDDNGKNIYVFIKDASGNISSTELTVVTIVDQTAPVVATNNITRSLDASGNVSVTAADFDNGTSDACGIDELTVSPSSFDCSNVGVNTLTFTATDVNGNTTNNTVYLTIEDNMAPTVVGQDITVELDGSGNAIIDAESVNNGSSDNCDFNLSINTTDFDCSNLGANTVTLTATDVNGNVSNVDVTVTVEDNTNPTAVAQDITVQLDATGNATITTGQINNGSLDNCSSSVLTYSLSKTTFDCTNIGANTVTLTATDASGNASTATATVTVEDNMNPIVTSINIARVLNANGEATIDVSTFAHGATDNCGIASFNLSKTDFDCSEIGLNTITLTVTDNNGNVSTADVFVMITDETAPTIATLPFGAIAERVIGECEADGFEYNLPTFNDNCGVATVALVNGLPSGAIFPVGTTQITYLATDESGNSVSASVFVTVEAQGTPSDLPVSTDLCKDGNVIALGNDATFTGNGVDGNEFNPSLAGEGVHELTWTYTDANGCEISGSVVMTVYPSANQPVIEQTSSSVLTANGYGYDSYQWYANGAIVNGATSQTLSITTAGDFQVIAYTANGCSSTSEVFDIGGGIFTPIKGYDIAETTLYPNPTTGKVYVDLGETLETVSIEVFDARGAKVKTFNFENMTSSTVEIELNELPSAMYHVVISSDVQVTTKKIVINK